MRSLVELFRGDSERGFVTKVIYEPLNQEDKKNYIIFSPKQNDMLIACVSGAHRGMPQKPGRERLVLVGTFDPVL